MIIVDNIKDFFRKKKKKPPLRDKKGRPYYLVSSPWYKRNPRTFVITGTIISGLILFSRPIYDIFFRPASDLENKPDFWWPSEKQRGIRQIDLVRQRKLAKGESCTIDDVFAPYVKREHDELMADYYRRLASGEINTTLLDDHTK